MQKVETEQAPKAVGPYSQGIICPPGATLVYISGQLPVDPKSNKLLEGDIQTLTKQVLNNIKAILTAAGTSFERVVRVEVFLKDLKKDFSGMNEEYSKHFVNSPLPVRQTIQVADLPLSSPIEISCIAIR